MASSTIGYSITGTSLIGPSLPPLQLSSQHLSLGTVTCLVLIFGLCVTSLPTDAEKGRRKVVHVLGKISPSLYPHPTHVASL